MKTPWTPGPWKVFENDGVVNGEERVASTRTYFGNQDKANAALIALAPEMADAILRWEKEPCESLETQRIFLDIAQRLRQIGEQTPD